MNLLPKTSKDFTEEEYWNSFFKRREQSFEWYGDYLQLSALLHKYIKSKDSLLVVGCGNSSLGFDLFTNGVENNVNVDVSDLVVKQMTKKYANDKRIGLKFLQMDVTKMSFENESFSVVLDKGTLDAIIADGHENETKAERMFSEIDRVLKVNGRYLCVSLLQSHILKLLIQWFESKGNYLLRIHRCFDAEEASKLESGCSSLVYPVFIVVCTKFLSRVTVPIELYLGRDVHSKPLKIKSLDDVKSAISSTQQYAILEYRLRNNSVPNDSEIFLELFSDTDEKNPRYSLFVLDVTSKECTTKYAIFIVPQGQETEWLFGTPEGRKDLAKMSKTRRLCVVHLNRDHVYDSLKAVQDELSLKVMDFAPKGLKQVKGKEIPFLSVGADVGKRVVKRRGKSEMSGEYTVEDVTLPDNTTYRRLIFLSNHNVIQSEAKLVEVNGQRRIDHSYLACRHHYGLFAGIVLQDDIRALKSKTLRILLVGLGGGCFTSFVQRNLKVNREVVMDVVEIDKEMVKIAKDLFGLKTNYSEKESVSTTIFIEDGIKFIKKRALDVFSDYDIIMFDVDSKDVKKGLSCPPQEFVEKSFLEDVYKLLFRNKGLFVLNLVARNASLKHSIKSDIKSLFPAVYSFKVPQEINELLYCFVEKPNCSLLRHEDKANIDVLVKEVLDTKRCRDTSDIAECLLRMTIDV